MRTAYSGSEPKARGGLFATTHWSVVLAASRQDLSKAAEALEQLCRTYWYPLYAYLRRRGYSAEDAEDLTQAFFAHLLRKDFLRGVGPEKGRFRSFLLACLKHFLVDEWQKERTAKRRHAPPVRFMERGRAEGRYQLETQGDTNPEAFYERRWALELLEHVLDRLREEAVAAGKVAAFDQLQGCLMGERPSETYAHLGTRLGLSEAAVKMSVHRLRQRCRDLMREEIAHTVAQPEEINEEMHYLFEVVSR